MGKRLFLADFEFRCGEYGQIFRKVFRAEGHGDLEAQIHGYLLDYYGEGNTSDIEDGVYYYNFGEVAVKGLGWVEIGSLEELVDRLL